MSKTKPEPSQPQQFDVLLPAGARPGLRSCGAYLPGQPYTVDAAEAQRLVHAKGFQFVNPADATLCTQVLEQRATAA